MQGKYVYKEMDKLPNINNEIKEMHKEKLKLIEELNIKENKKLKYSFSACYDIAPGN